MKTVAILAAAGCGKRLGTKRKKPFVLLGGKPLVSYALKALNDCKSVGGIIIASERPCVAKFKAISKRFTIDKLIDIIVGGKTRFESVCNCVKTIGPSFDIVLIHDAARPFIDIHTIERSIEAAIKFGASVAAVPESDTVKLSDGALFVEKTLDRSKIFRAQTPQAFKLSVIKKAIRAESGRRGRGVTDDASLAERIGHRVKIVNGSYRNIKITTKEDLRIAKGLL